MNLRVQSEFSFLEVLFYFSACSYSHRPASMKEMSLGHTLHALIHGKIICTYVNFWQTSVYLTCPCTPPVREACMQYPPAKPSESFS